MQHPKIIAPRSGVSFVLKKGEFLKVIDLQGEQVADLVCYNFEDRKEYLSSGRTIDYAETIFLTKGHVLYSNRSNSMMEIVEDTVGRHDFLLTPCSADTFRIIYGHQKPHQGCFGNLTKSLAAYGIGSDAIPVSFNIFMHVALNEQTGKITVLPPKSKAGDFILLRASIDLIVGLTACSAEMSNNYSFKPIAYQIEAQRLQQ
ncbi:MAG: urea carboxylase-associated family protein [Flavisolibacter sp.]